MRIKSINIDSNRILIDEPLEYVSKFLEVTEDARLTQLGKYELLSHAKTYFARKLKSTKDENYLSPKLKQVNDTEIEKALMEENAKNAEKYDLWWYNYKQEHPEEFEEAYAIPNFTEIDEEGNWKSKFDFHTDISGSSKDYWDCYQICNRALKDFDSEDLKTMIKIVSKQEFKNLHKELQIAKKLELGFPEELVYNTIPKIEIESYNIARVSKARPFSEDNSLLDEYFVEFAQYLLDECKDF